MSVLPILLFAIFFCKGHCQCPQSNGRFPVADQCDAYIECRDGQAETLLCPDGLLFNDRKERLDRYPCDYPIEVDCGSRGRVQPADPTENCPHQYGLYSNGGGNNCGQFWNCVSGKAHLFDCPEGLAFNADTMRCDWPDEVPTCDPESFLGFRCPPPDPASLQLSLGNPQYPHPSDCTKFYVCVDGTKPRLLGCEAGLVFNPTLSVCDEPENVPGCSARG